jgi:hypothetical protein
MPAQFPGAYNTFVPNHEATKAMVIDFSRNPSKFPVNRYIQVVPVSDPIGYYLAMTVEERGRIRNTDGSEFKWADGNDAPAGQDGTESFEYKAYRQERYAFPFRFGDMTVKNASWDIVAQHAAIKAQQAMTHRTQQVATLLTTSGNYPSANTAAVTAIAGNTGAWNQSTPGRKDIQRSLNYGAETILDATLGGLQLSDLVLIISSSCARQIAECQEIVDYIKGSPDAKAQLVGDKASLNAKRYGLPDQLYGFDLVIEDTRKVTSKKGATRAVSQIWPVASAVLASRPGGLVGVAGAPSFSTATCFVNSEYEMAVETLDDRNNKRTTGRVIDMFDLKMTAGASGFLFTSAIA